MVHVAGYLKTRSDKIISVLLLTACCAISSHEARLFLTPLWGVSQWHWQALSGETIGVLGLLVVYICLIKPLAIVLICIAFATLFAFANPDRARVIKLKRYAGVPALFLSCLWIIVTGIMAIPGVKSLHMPHKQHQMQPVAASTPLSQTAPQRPIQDTQPTTNMGDWMPKSSQDGSKPQINVEALKQAYPNDWQEKLKELQPSMDKKAP